MEKRGNVVADQNANSGSDQQFRMLQLIYFAILFSLVTYLVTGFLLRPTRLPPWGMKTVATLIQAFYFLSAGLIALIFLVRRKIYRGSPTAQLSPEEASKQIGFYRNGHVLIYVLCEAIGLIGLILLFMAGSIQHFVNLILVSFILLVVLYPRKMTVNNL